MNRVRHAVAVLAVAFLSQVFAGPAVMTDVLGIENIHVNKFVPYSESYTGKSVGNASLWLKMTEDGLAKKLYLEHHVQGAAFITNNCLPDAFFPTNTVVAHVWRGRGSSLTNVYNLLTMDVAKTVFDPEVVNLLTNFGPLVKSVTRGVGSATIPYVDTDGNQQLGKALVLGCATNDWTAYNVLVKELKKIGQGYEECPYFDTRRYVVTNSTVRIFGSRTPSVAFGSMGYLIISSSEGVWAAVEQAAVEYGMSGKKAFYDERHLHVVAGDAELRKVDPTYSRDFKTEGFERFGYAFVSPAYQAGLAKMLEGCGISPMIACTNTFFGYNATLCSEKSANENERMRIDLQGSKAALRAIGATLRVSNLFLVNAGLLDENFMTFDEDWKFDPQTLAKVKGLSAMIREKTGFKGADYYFKEADGRTMTFADVGYVPGKKFEQLFCAGKAGNAEQNPCGRCLPTNTVAGFVFQPEVTAWVDLNRHFLSLFGKEHAILEKVFAAFKSHPDSFGKSATIGQTSNRGFLSAVKIENENLWVSIRILLEQLGCTVSVSKTWPSVTVCHLPDSEFDIAYDREYKILQFVTSKELGLSVQAALRDPAARLVSPLNKTFSDRMGLDGVTFPDRNVYYYIAPGTDTAFLASLSDYFDTIGLGVLNVLIKTENLSDLWLCGYGVKDDNGLFAVKSNISKDFWDRHHPLFEAACKTFGQIAAAAFPYDASKARAFTFGKMTLHVSRADNWDDVNGCLFDYTGDNVRFRYQGTLSNGQTVDQTFNGRLEADGFFKVGDETTFDRGYFTSEGIFAEYKQLSTGYYVARETSQIEPELSVLPSAEEIAEQLKKVVDAIGVENVAVGAAKSDDRTGPDGEPTVVRETTVVPTPGGGLSKLLAGGECTYTPMDRYVPSNTVFGVSMRVADGALTNILAAIKYAQPELVEWIEKLLLGVGLDESLIGDSLSDAFACGLARQENELEPYFAARLKSGKHQNWATLTNGLYHTKGVTVTGFQASQTPGVWESLSFSFADPLSRRKMSRCFTRIFEGDNRDAVFIISSDDAPNTDLSAKILMAGLNGVGRLVDSQTFKACKILSAGKGPSPDFRGFIYHAPTEVGCWFYDRISVSEDGELVIRRRTSAGVAPYESTVARFAVNYFEALSGEKSNITFANDAEADKIAIVATSNVVAALHKMRTTLGVTGLDFYDSGLDADGRYGNSELAIGTKGDGCEFLRRFAADEPASEHLVEQYIPATACALATMNGEAGTKVDDVNAVLKASAELLAEKHPKASAAITNFLASTAWKIATENVRLTGTHKALAVLQVPERPFVQPLRGGTNVSLSAGYAALAVIGPMTNNLPFYTLKEALDGKEGWATFTTNGVEYLTMPRISKKLYLYVQPTFAFDASNKMMIVSTRFDAARAAMEAGREGWHRLVDSDTFFDVTGFKKGEPLPAHNSLYYFAPQNDDILGCTLRRVLSPYLPASYAMLLDRPSLKGYWGAAYGVRVKDAFRLYTHAGAKGHTAFIALAQALLKTAAEGIRVRQPYDWTESKVFRSADKLRVVDPTDEDGLYACCGITDAGAIEWALFLESDSDNAYTLYGMDAAIVLAKDCMFASARKGLGLAAGRDAFHLMFIDEESDPDDYTHGITMEFDAFEQTLAAGEKVEQKLRLWPANAKVTKVSGLPKGLSLKKTNDGYFLTGAPIKVGEDCVITLTATCVGRQTTTCGYHHFMVSNYESEYAELDADYDLTAGVADSLSLTNVIGWTASGLPSGMKFDKATGALSGTPVKPGEYVVIFTKKIAGRTEKVSTVITVDQGEGISIDVGFKKGTYEFAADGETREIYAGVKIDWPIEVKGLEDVATTLSAKGLPSGLKLVKMVDKATKEVSYAIKGIATKASLIDKKTGLVKPSTVTLTGKNKYKWSGVESFDLVIKALPDWAIGTFNGYHGNALGVIHASTKVTVSKVGKISIAISGVSSVSGKVTIDTFSFNGFDGYDVQNHCFAFAGDNVKAKSGIAYRYSGAIGLDPSAIITIGRYGASYQSGAKMVVEQANNHDWTVFVFPSGKSQRTLALTNEENPGLEGLTLKFAKGGSVTIAGTVLDSETGKNVRISASAQLVYRSEEDMSGDGIFPASVGFVVKTKTPFFVYVPVWLKRFGDTMVEVYETDPTKSE